MTLSLGKARRVAATGLALAVSVGIATLGACSNSQSSCSAPSSGSFSVPLSFSQTIDVAIYCGGATGDAVACGTQAHVFDGQTWTVTVDGSAATVTSNAQGAPSWSCQATTPQSSPAAEGDGGTIPGTGCYLLVSCNPESGGEAGPVDVQIQIFAQASGDAMVVVHELGGDCCADEYTGTWQ